MSNVATTAGSVTDNENKRAAVLEAKREPDAHRPHKHRESHITITHYQLYPLGQRSFKKPEAKPIVSYVAHLVHEGVPIANAYSTANLSLLHTFERKLTVGRCVKRMGQMAVIARVDMLPHHMIRKSAYGLAEKQIFWGQIATHP